MKSAPGSRGFYRIGRDVNHPYESGLLNVHTVVGGMRGTLVHNHIGRIAEGLIHLSVAISPSTIL